jgi:hypothetical protein
MFATRCREDRSRHGKEVRTNAQRDKLPMAIELSNDSHHAEKVYCAERLTVLILIDANRLYLEA